MAHSFCIQQVYIYFTNYYKTRQIPKLINKNFKHKTVDEELDDNDKTEINKNNIYLLNNNVNNLHQNKINKYIGL